MNRATDEVSWLRGLIRALPVEIPQGQSEAQFALDAEQRRMAAMSKKRGERSARATSGGGKRTMVAHTSMIDDNDLNDPGKQALYGREAIEAERARRNARRAAQEPTYRGHGEMVDLRGHDLPPPRDPWELERIRRGYEFDPVAAAGLQGNLPGMQGYEEETRRRAQAAATLKQRARWEVCIGAVVRLRDGTVLAGGAPIDETLVDHPHALEVLSALVARNVVSEIDGDLAWLRSLPEHIGPWVATCDVEFSNGKKFKRGDSVCEEDCPAPPPPRFTDDLKASELTVAELRQLIVAEIDKRVPPPLAVSLPPPMSEWQCATKTRTYGLASVERAVNYVAGAAAPKRKGLFR